MIVEVIERRLQRRGDIDLKESLPNRVSFLDEADVHRVDPLLGCLEGWTEDGIPTELASRAGWRVGVFVWPVVCRAIRKANVAVK